MVAFYIPSFSLWLPDHAIERELLFLLKKITGALSQPMCCCKYLHDYVEEHKLSKHQVFNNDETGL